MLFSALVDADFLDTEAFMNAGQGRRAATAFPPLKHYRERLDEHLARMAQRVVAEGREPGPVMRAARRCAAPVPRARRLPPRRVLARSAYRWRQDVVVAGLRAGRMPWSTASGA